MLFVARGPATTPAQMIERLLPIVVALIVVLVVWYFIKQAAKRRTIAMRATAAALGWTFNAEPLLSFFPGLEDFSLFSQGHSREARNLMQGEANGVKASVFDYRYKTGSGRYVTIYNQTVVYVQPANLDLPYFSLRPEGLMAKLGAAFGNEDIDFGQRPEFSREFLLRGEDEPAIRRLFSDRVLTFYEGYPGVSTDAGGDKIFVYRAARQFQPQEIQSYVGLALQVAGLFQS